MSLLHLLLLIAATWRLSNLVANEDGPFHFFKTLRSKAARAEVRSRRKNGFISRFHLYELLNCEYCSSVWFAVLLVAGWYFSEDVFYWVVLPLAISTGVILVKTIVQTIKGVDVYLDHLNTPKVIIHEKTEPPKDKVMVLDWDGLYKEQSFSERR